MERENRRKLLARTAPCARNSRMPLKLLPSKARHLLTAGMTVALLPACRTTRETDMFTAIDSDRSGSLTLVEAESYGFKRMFDRFDKNKDGVISSADGESAGPNLLRTRDLDGDGKITFEEYAKAGRQQGAVKRLFNAADADHDGKISPQETQQYLSAGGGGPLTE